VTPVQERGPRRRRAVASCLLLIGLCGAAAAGQSTGAGTIQGTVMSPHGTPLDAAVVTLIRLDPGETDSRRTARTSADGRFLFDHLADGRYRVAAARAGYTDIALDHAGEWRHETRDVTLSAGQTVDPVSLVLRRAGSIAGRILRPDGSPAVADVMAVLPGAGARPRSVVTQTTTTVAGRYELRGLPAGEFVVAARPEPATFLGHDEASRAAVTAITVFPGVPEAAGGTPVRVLEGIATEGIDVWLQPAPERFMVTGRVVDAAGHLVRGIAIEYSDETGLRRGVWQVNDPDGHFEIEGMPPGMLLMLARGESDAGPRAGMAATMLAVESAHDVQLVVGPPGRVEGRLVAAAGATLPAAAARVALVHTRMPVSVLYPVSETVVRTDGQFVLPRAFGAYRIDVTNLPDGWRVVRVLRDGREIPGGEITVMHDERVTGIDVVVGPTAPPR
jgi:hypothetical protein